MKRKSCSVLLAAMITLVTAISFVPVQTATASYVDDFLATVGPMCTNDMKNNRILASFTMAQAIYESGWGRSELAVNANNLFGMRAYSTWEGKVYDKNQGVLYNSWAELVAKKGSSYVNSYSMSFWRAFDSWEESVHSHSELFNSSSRYSNLRGNYNYKSCCKLVVEDGYCTDSGYTENLIGLIESYNLEQYNYVFAPGEEDENKEPTIEELYGKNLFAGLNVSYYLKGKWNEYNGTTTLATDGKFRGDGSNAWSGNSAVSGVTYDTANYNGTSATTNYFCFNMASAADIALIQIKGYREDGNRNYASLEIYVSEEAVAVNADNCQTITAELKKADYTMEKATIQDAPQSNAADQFFDLTLSFEDLKGVKGVLIKTNADCSSQGFFQFDEITAYSPIPCDPFTFTETADTAYISIDNEKTYLTFKAGALFSADIKALFEDEDMSISDANGNAVSDTARASTGCVIT
ncbi:MAG: glucosaminidase domain-containing protein, partial [Clostridia bacterium]|nr:glucosaminidase domain-containing protein [Clostridia bacterium]